MPIIATFSEVANTRVLGHEMITLADYIAETNRVITELQETVAALIIEVNRQKDENEYLAKRQENDAK